MRAAQSKHGLYHNPVSVVWGAGAVRELPQLIPGGQNVLLLYGQSSLLRSGMYDELRAMLKHVNVVPLGGIPPLPDIMDLPDIIKEASIGRYDTILAVGGGSVIDTAKVIRAFSNDSSMTEDKLRSAIQESRYATPESTLIAVPTIAGSGSEVTRWATVWDRQLQRKYSVDASSLYPHYAVVDHELTHTLPIRSAVIGALDALCHAVEAYWATASNTLSRAYSLAAIRALLQGVSLLTQTMHDDDLGKAREMLSSGSLLAGQAFSHTRTTACHAISYPLSLRFGIEHGIAVAMSLSAVLALNVPALASSDELFRALDISAPEELQGKLQELAMTVGCSLRLRDHGVAPDMLEKLVPHCYTKGRMDNNPVQLEEGTILAILESIY